MRPSGVVGQRARSIAGLTVNPGLRSVPKPIFDIIRSVASSFRLTYHLSATMTLSLSEGHYRVAINTRREGKKVAPLDEIAATVRELTPVKTHVASLKFSETRPGFKMELVLRG